MNSPARFRIGGQGVASEPYHYTMCGLDDVYLLNGFEVRSGPYGKGVAIHHADALHKEIGLYLILNRKTLNKREVKFLRKQMDLTQGELAKCLGVTGQTIARYEKGETEIPGPVDKLIRFSFAFYLLPEEERAKLINELMKAQNDLGEIDETMSAPVYFQTKGAGWDEIRMTP